MNEILLSLILLFAYQTCDQTQPPRGTGGNGAFLVTCHNCFGTLIEDREAEEMWKVSASARGTQAWEATSTSAPADKVKMANLNLDWSNPTDYTIVGSELTFHCYYEPIVKKEKDGKWTITFKP
jgi:hypothetical protein